MVAALEKDVNFSVEMVIATVDSDNYIFEPNLCSQLLVESDQHFSFRERQSLSNDISSVPENERQKFDHSHGVALKIIDHIQKLPSLCDTNSSSIECNAKKELKMVEESGPQRMLEKRKIQKVEAEEQNEYPESPSPPPTKESHID
ncbi:unnamed protein product [Dracunculus medinensis]|uniref:Ovule protein n=1 Tax=Dracunculus medinensis TaxID=318479 RepID=A0A0N4UF54_DRAME|nr:unnamed protein product [Dracunculus medinensis]